MPDSTPGSAREQPRGRESDDTGVSMSDEYLERLYLFKKFKTASVETMGDLGSALDSNATNTLDTLATMEGDAEDVVNSESRFGRLQQKETALPAWGLHALFAMGYNVKEVIACCESSTVVIRRFETGPDNHSVAVKCLSTRNQEQRDSIQKEYDVLKQLSHKNIVRAVALHQTKFDMWLCMECCQGTVETHVNQHGPICQASKEAQLLRELAEGVGYLHTLGGIAHRDLRPSSLLLRQTEAGLQLRIGGFGRARPLAGRLALRAGVDLGIYSAPEVWLNHMGMEEAADVWSLGMCLCFMLLGESGLPVHLDGSLAISRLLTLGLPEQRWPGVSPGMELLLRQCLALQASCRPDASDLLAHAEFSGEVPFP